MPPSPSLSFNASFPSSPSSSPSFGPVDSSPPSSPNLHPLSSPPGSPRPTDPFAGGTKGVKRPRIYEKRNRYWADEVDSPDNSFVMSGYHPPSFDIDLRSESEFEDLLSEPEGSEPDEDEFWEKEISQAIDNGNGVINLNNSLIHGCLTTIPPTIADLANLVVLHPQTQPLPPSPSRVPAKREFRRVVTEPVITPSSKFLVDTTLTKATSFMEVPVLEPQNRVHLSLVNNAIRRLPVELFWVHNLTVLRLRGNLLTHIPPQISNLRNLRELNIALNKLSYLPAEMLDMDLVSLSLSRNPWLQPPATKPAPSGKSRVASDSTTHFSIPTLSELCMRTLLAPFPSRPSPQEKDETVLEALYALPLSGTEYYPRNLLEILHACVPSAVAKLDSQTEGSPSKKARRCISATRNRFGSSSASIPHSSSHGPRGSHVRDREKETHPGVGSCPSPIHRVDGRKAVFVKHAEERFTWEDFIAGVNTGEPSGVPLLWRGCSKGCLDFLGPRCEDPQEDLREEDDTDVMWEGDTEAVTTDTDDDVGVQAVDFGDEELGFD